MRRFLGKLSLSRLIWEINSRWSEFRAITSSRIKLVEIFSSLFCDWKTSGLLIRLSHASWAPTGQTLSLPLSIVARIPRLVSVPSHAFLSHRRPDELINVWLLALTAWLHTYIDSAIPLALITVTSLFDLNIAVSIGCVLLRFGSFLGGRAINLLSPPRPYLTPVLPVV